jgi:hypothetical protein
LGYSSLKKFAVAVLCQTFLPKLASKINCDKTRIYLFPVPKRNLANLFFLNPQFCLDFTNRILLHNTCLINQVNSKEYMSRFLFLILFSSSLSCFATDSLLTKIDWQYLEVPIYQQYESFAGQTTLQMGYANHKISNPRIWSEDIRKKYIYEVDLVLSKYPTNKEKWVTNYDTLMRNRVKELYELIPELEQNTRITWNIVLQTDCQTEDEAKAMFHGAVIKYKLHLTNKLKKTLHNIRDIVNGKEGFEDSVVFKVFDRNKWGNMLVVNDWTGSMYQYGAQAVLWHRLNMKNSVGDTSNIQDFVFFNDGNLLPDDEKKIGETGGIYHTKVNSIRTIAHSMREVMLSGYGGDKPENDLEAILYGLSKSDSLNQIVLIADNNSAVRDMELLDKINKPIKIILCGSQLSNPIHADYLQIARKTNGSIHTISEDILDLANKKNGDVIELNGLFYSVSANGFERLEIVKP